MALPVSKIIFGVDVGKDELVIFNRQSKETIAIANQIEAIGQWLDSIQGPAQIAVEPTSHYHLALVDAALARGHRP